MAKATATATVTKRGETIDIVPAGASAGPDRPDPASFNPDLAEIVEIVRSVVATLRGDFSAADVTLYGELQALGAFIAATKAEIAAIRPDDIQQKHLPTATDELSAVVGATAQATGEILDVVEQIEKLGPQLAAEHAAKVTELVTRIYEACNFQDITGQRITKVVKALQQIDTKVAAILAAFGDKLPGEHAPRAPDASRAAVPAATAQPSQATPSEADLLNGPQLPGQGISQADIDALFGD
jgi:chemotaxis protein CheZ